MKTVEVAAEISPTVGGRLTLPAALGAFFLSGFAALLYQVVWQRMLVFFSGADVYSVTVTVAAFMAGLGCGSLAGGYIADRVPQNRALALFGLAELLVGAFALLSKGFYYDFLYAQHGYLARDLFTLGLVLFLSMLFPTFFMGMSLPLLSRALASTLEAAPGTIGALYGVNTFGAAVGSLVTTWFLLRRFDFESVLQLGTALNLACAATAIPLGLLTARPLARAREPVPAHNPGGVESGLGFGAWAAVYGLTGFINLSLEVLWFRLLSTMLKATAFTFGTLLGVYLGGLALGTLAGIGLVGRSRSPARTFLLLEAAVGAYALASLTLLVATVDGVPALAPLWRYFSEYEPLDVGQALAYLRAYLLGTAPLDPTADRLTLKFLGIYFLLPAAIVGPPTFLMGLSFPFLQKATQTDVARIGRRGGWLQTANIAGSLAGTVATGTLLLATLGTAETLRLLVALSGGLLLLAASLTGSLARRAAWGLVALGLWGAVLLGGPPADFLWAKLHGTTPDRVIFFEDGSGLSLIKNERPDFGGRSFIFANGRGESWVPYGGTHTLLGVLPAMLHPEPKEVAVIGLGSGDTLFNIASRPETIRVTCIEIVGSQLDALRTLAARQPYRPLQLLWADPRIELVVGDGRTYLARSGRKFDIIEADALRPNSAYAGNLYSLEYFTLMRERLKPGGLAVTWVPTLRTHDTFVKAFPYVVSFGIILVGSNEPIVVDREAIWRRLSDPFVVERYRDSGLDIPGGLRWLLDTYPPAFIGPEFDRSAIRDINRDLQPKDEFMVAGRLP